MGSAPLAAPAEGGTQPPADLALTPQTHHHWSDQAHDWWINRADMVRNDWDYV